MTRKPPDMAILPLADSQLVKDAKEAKANERRARNAARMRRARAAKAAARTYPYWGPPAEPASALPHARPSRFDRKESSDD